MQLKRCLGLLLFCYYQWRLARTGSLCLRSKGCPEDLVEGPENEVTILSHSEGDHRTENQGLPFVYVCVGVGQFWEERDDFIGLGPMKLMRMRSTIDCIGREGEVGVRQSYQALWAHRYHLFLRLLLGLSGRSITLARHGFPWALRATPPSPRSRISHIPESCCNYDIYFSCSEQNDIDLLRSNMLNQTEIEV